MTNNRKGKVSGSPKQWAHITIDIKGNDLSFGYLGNINYGILSEAVEIVHKDIEDTAIAWYNYDNELQ